MAFVVYDNTEGEATARPIVRVFETQAEANTHANTSTELTAYNGAVTDDLVDVDWYINPTGGAVTAMLPVSVQTADQLASWKSRLAEAWRTYNDSRIHTSRQDWWPSLQSGTNARRPLIATDRWAYAQIALGDAISRYAGNNQYLNTAAKKEVLIAHIISVISTLGLTWYNVMTVNNADNGLAEDWVTWSIQDEASIYTDIFGANWVTQSPTGRGILTVPSMSIAQKFAPDRDNLRKEGTE